MPHRVRIHLLLWSGALAFFLAPPVHATSLAEVSVDASASFLPGCSQSASGVGAQTLGCLVSDYARASSSQASAGPGFVRADALAAADAPDVNLAALFASSRAYASFADSVTFFGPANTEATIHGQIYVHGSVVSDTWGSPFSGLGQASYTVTGGMFGAPFGVSGTYADFADGTSMIVNSSVGQLVPLTFVVSFDSAGRSTTGSFLVSVTVTADANARAGSDPTTGVLLPGHTEAQASFGNTVAWAGVLSVLDAQGNPLAGVSAISDSGLDYMGAAIPIPEPAVACLLASATLLTRHRGRARRRS